MSGGAVDAALPTGQRGEQPWHTQVAPYHRASRVSRPSVAVRVRGQRSGVVCCPKSPNIYILVYYIYHTFLERTSYLVRAYIYTHL